MARKKKGKDNGVLGYVSPKFRKDVKRLVRELGLEFILAEKVEQKE